MNREVFKSTSYSNFSILQILVCTSLILDLVIWIHTYIFVSPTFVWNKPPIGFPHPTPGCNEKILIRGPDWILVSYLLNIKTSIGKTNILISFVVCSTFFITGNSLFYLPVARRFQNLPGLWWCRWLHGCLQTGSCHRCIPSSTDDGNFWWVAGTCNLFLTSISNKLGLLKFSGSYLQVKLIVLRHSKPGNLWFKNLVYCQHENNECSLAKDNPYEMSLVATISFKIMMAHVLDCTNI